MGLLSRWKTARTDDVDVHDTIAPERLAHNEVWDREIARLGRDEVIRRLAALSDYRSGRSGPSGFESWNRQVEAEIDALARDIASRTGWRGLAPALD